MYKTGYDLGSRDGRNLFKYVLVYYNCKPNTYPSISFTGVVGRPGVDFPILSNIPVTDFSCRKFKSPGYYADLDTNCQVSRRVST
jgi:hypothetical protein